MKYSHHQINFGLMFNIIQRHFTEFSELLLTRIYLKIKKFSNVNKKYR